MRGEHPLSIELHSQITYQHLWYFHRSAKQTSEFNSLTKKMLEINAMVIFRKKTYVAFHMLVCEKGVVILETLKTINV